MFYNVASFSQLHLVEYTPQAYVPSDLDKFFGNFSKSQIGERPVLKSIDGGSRHCLFQTAVPILIAI